MFLVEVPDRSEATLLRYIQNYVNPGSIIYSDLWKGYQNILPKLGLLHFTVNHSKEFVNLQTGVHTNTIEGSWSRIKQKISNRSRVKETINLHLLEFIWRRNNANNVGQAFLNAIKIYN